MKLLEIHDWNHGGYPTVALATDSSIVSGRRPVFLPDISEDWECQVSVAYRISRLGKSIGRKFAERYYDSMTLCARFLPLDMMRQLSERGESLSPLATAFDGAIAIGDWIPAAKAESIAVESPVSITADIDASGCSSIDEMNRSLEYLSRTFIIKTGDIIIPAGYACKFRAKIDTHVSASLNNSEVLTFNIK